MAKLAIPYVVMNTIDEFVVDLDLKQAWSWFVKRPGIYELGAIYLLLSPLNGCKGAIGWLIGFSRLLLRLF